MTLNKFTVGISVCAAILIGISACGSPGGLSPQYTQSGPLTPSNANAAALLAAHNGFRARHGAKTLTWSPALASGAQNSADQCVFAHNNPRGVGENLLRWTGQRSEQEQVDLWYSEGASYDYASGSARDGSVTGHFSQVVWKGSTELGCGVTQCPSIGTFLVCRYAPAGNVIGRYQANVSAPQ